MSRLLRIVLGLLLVLLLAVGAAAGLVWWKLGSLKAQLLAGLGKNLGAEVQVTSLDLDPWKSELHAAGITMTNQRSSSPWEKGDIAQATIRYHLADLFSSPIPIKVELSSWNVVLHSPLRTAETPAPDDASGEAGGQSHRVEVKELLAHAGSVEVDFSDDRKIVVSGVDFNSNEDGGIWTTQVQATSIQAGTLAAGASSVKIRGDADKLTFTDLHLQCDPGVITGEGDVATGGVHEAQLTLKAVDLPVTMLVALAWQPQLSGLATVNLSYTGNDQGGTAQGDVAINHAKCNVLPWLGKVTSMVGLPDISGVELDTATSKFSWTNGTLELTDLDVRKNDVTRIGGTVAVDPLGNVDGKLKLGLPSTVTAKWPQLQTDVFPTAVDGYNWADVHLTGTPNRLQEDLSPRLLAAGLKQSGDLLNQAAQKAGDVLNSLLGK